MKYYSLKKIKRLNATINVIIGQRSNGKSYAVKEEVINRYFDNNEKFCYIRRTKKQRTQNKIEEQFCDRGIEKLIEKRTKGKYNCLKAYRGYICLNNSTEKLNEELPIIGYYTSVEESDDLKGSQIFQDVKNIFFDEFMTSSSIYFANEIIMYNNLLSTIARNRNDLKIYLCANTISRVCPYLDEYGISEIIDKIEQGKIYQITQRSKDGERVIALEYCKSTVSNNLFAGSQSSSMINSGDWETKSYLRLPNKLRNYKTLYKIYVDGGTFNFAWLLLQDDNGICTHIHPTGNDKTRFDKILTNKFSMDRKELSRLDKLNPYESIMLSYRRTNHETFATNLCGTDFENVMKMQGYE